MSKQRYPEEFEPHRVSWRPIGLSQAATAVA